MQKRAFGPRMLRVLACLLVLAVGDVASANRSDCFLFVSGLGSDGTNTPGGAFDASSCRVDLPASTGPMPTTVPGATPLPGTAYLDAQHTYQTFPTVGSTGPLPTALPQQRSRVEMGLNAVTLDPSGAFGAGGIEILQPFTGSHSGGQASALAQVVVDLSATITLQADTPNVTYEALLGADLALAGAFDSWSIVVDQDGGVTAPTGIVVVDLGSGVFSISGSLTSTPVLLATDGTVQDYNLIVFGQGVIAPVSGISIASGRIVIDSSNTAISRIVSLDPQANFTLGAPIPEPGLLMLGALGVVALFLSTRRRRA